MVAPHPVLLLSLLALLHAVAAFSPLLSPGEARMVKRKVQVHHAHPKRIAGAVPPPPVSAPAAAPASVRNATAVANASARRAPSPNTEPRDKNWSQRIVEKRYTVYQGGSGTWYSGGALDNPACGGSTPSDSSSIVAVPTSSPAKCWDWIRIHYNGHVAVAQVVDQCATCGNSLDVDMTKSVFQQLASLDVGELNNIHWRVLNNDD